MPRLEGGHGVGCIADLEVKNPSCTSIPLSTSSYLAESVSENMFIYNIYIYICLWIFYQELVYKKPCGQLVSQWGGCPHDCSSKYMTSRRL